MDEGRSRYSLTDRRSRMPRTPRDRGDVPSVPVVDRARAVDGGAEAAGEVELFGDLPFMVDGDSADVWARQEQFHLDVSLGVPLTHSATRARLGHAGLSMGRHRC